MLEWKRGQEKGKNSRWRVLEPERKWPRLKKREWCLLSPSRKTSRVGGHRIGKADESHAGEGSRNQNLPCDRATGEPWICHKICVFRKMTFAMGRDRIKVRVRPHRQSIQEVIVPCILVVATDVERKQSHSRSI